MTLVPSPLRIARLATLLGATFAPSAALAQAAPPGVPTNPGPLAPPRAPAKAAKAATDEKPWRAHEALGLSWLKFGLEHRARYEHLVNDFRKDATGDSRAAVLRTSLWAALDFKSLFIGAEALDSRVYENQHTVVNNGISNPVELLQAIVSFRHKDVITDGDATAITAGRMTLDVGSRRLSARNEFRNTINSFTGLDLQWTGPKRDHVRLFAVAPVTRLPSKAGDLAKNEIELDRENSEAMFLGAFYETRPLPGDVHIEGYVFGLRERDTDVAPSANRRLVTPGVRIFRDPSDNHFDYQVEAMGQFGTSRASNKADDTTDLDHKAWSTHSMLGYRVGVPWHPRVALVHDYASGDTSATDGENNRFDPLFGARRFEFGPTGLYGAFARSNIQSPGVRLDVQPHKKVDAFAAYRLFWLASDTDAWTTASLRDKAGESGSFVGQQIEGRIRWHVLPRNLAFDIGGAAILRGEFAKTAKDAVSTTPLYGYAQLTATL